MIFAPPRTRGPYLLGAAALAAGALGLALLVRGLVLPISFGAYFALTLGVLLLAAAVPLAYWSWAAFALRYELRGGTLIVRWGLAEERIPAAAIERIVLGRHLPLPSVRGLCLPGLAVGSARVRGIGTAALFARFTAPADLLYAVTERGTIGLALAEQRPFVAALQAAAREGTPNAKPAARYDLAPLFGFFGDRWARALAGAALALVWFTGLIVYSRFQRLPQAITVHYPPTEAPHLAPRSALVHIPAQALAWLAVTLVTAVLLRRHAPRAGYLVLASAIVAGGLFLVGAIAP
jgi:hypothetical protein